MNNICFPTFKKSEDFLKMLSPFSGEREDLFAYPGNRMFEGADVDVLYSFCRWLKPKNIIELGTGYSSLFMAEAWKLQGENFREHVAIDPSSERFDITGREKFRRIRGNTEDVPLDLFDVLQKGDFLFIDSGHSDQQAEYYIQNIFPRLSAGVYVHNHDIDIIDFNFSRCNQEDHAGRGSSEETVLLKYIENGERLNVLHSNHIGNHNENVRSLYRKYMKYKGDDFGASFYYILT